jgi:hypothetical protein
MSKLTRNTSDPQSREFWESVDRGAAEIANAPAWMLASRSTRGSSKPSRRRTRSRRRVDARRRTSSASAATGSAWS